MIMKQYESEDRKTGLYLTVINVNKAMVGGPCYKRFKICSGTNDVSLISYIRIKETIYFFQRNEEEKYKGLCKKTFSLVQYNILEEEEIKQEPPVIIDMSGETKIDTKVLLEE